MSTKLNPSQRHYLWTLRQRFEGRRPSVVESLGKALEFTYSDEAVEALANRKRGWP